MSGSDPHPPPIELDGTWRAEVARGDLGKAFFEPGFDDCAWSGIEVPGHWRDCGDFASSDGPILYRRTFTSDTTSQTQRWWLEIDGCFYYGDFWLDGTYLGATEGYFVPHCFDVTELIAQRCEHLLAAEVACPTQTHPTAQRTITGEFSSGRTIDPEFNAGGLWRPLRLRATGALRLSRARITCIEASESRGRLAIDLTVDAGDITTQTDAVLTAEVRGPDGTPLAEHLDVLTVAAGENRRRVEVRVDDPPLWWPHRLGAQPMCTVDVRIDHGGSTSDALTRRVGFRDIRRRDWIFHINGERIFLMGSNQGPARMQLARATRAEMARDVALTKDANLDFLRLHAHISRRELYDAADDAGVLIWQDFPLQRVYARGVRRQAVRQAQVMVDELAHHPSIFCWCAHNEPVAPAVDVGAPAEPSRGARIASTMTLPTWNKDVLDRSVARAIRHADATRPVVRHSGILPGPTEGGTDTHIYYGWYRGEVDGLAELFRRWPRVARFVSEFGAQAVPETDEFMTPGNWPHLDWTRLEARHCLERELLESRVSSAGISFDEWRSATQRYQAALVQVQVEDLRRLKYKPTGGFAQFCFADSHPSISWSVLDHERRQKLAYDALKNACRPLLGMLDPRNGAIHNASELREPLAQVQLTATVDGVSRRFGGDIEPDCVAYIGTADCPRHFAEVVVEHEAIGTVRNVYPPDLVGLLAEPT